MVAITRPKRHQCGFQDDRSWGKFDKLAVTGTVVPSAKKVVRGRIGWCMATEEGCHLAVQRKVFRGTKGELRTHGKRWFRPEFPKKSQGKVARKVCAGFHARRNTNLTGHLVDWVANICRNGASIQLESNGTKREYARYTEIWITMSVNSTNSFLVAEWSLLNFAKMVEYLLVDTKVSWGFLAGFCWSWIWWK